MHFPFLFFKQWYANVPLVHLELKLKTCASLVQNLLLFLAHKFYFLSLKNTCFPPFPPSVQIPVLLPSFCNNDHRSPNWYQHADMLLKVISANIVNYWSGWIYWFSGRGLLSASPEVCLFKMLHTSFYPFMTFYFFFILWHEEIWQVTTSSPN